MKKRRHSKRYIALQERLISWAKQVRADAASLPYGAQKDALIRKARQAETASRLEDWVNSPGLQPPR